jgi:hypothetical protein
LAAVFGPLSHTPGTLSIEIAGQRQQVEHLVGPHDRIRRSRRAGRAARLVIVLTSVMPGSTSWPRSLSDVEFTVSMPALFRLHGAWPYTSSASHAFDHQRSGQPCARAQLVQRRDLQRRSSGIACGWRLYPHIPHRRGTSCRAHSNTTAK